MAWMLVALTLLAWTISAIAFFEWRRTHRTSLIYAHLALFIAPVLLAANQINCMTGYFSGLLAFCTTAFARIVLYALPPTMLLTFFGGYFLAPHLYKRTFRARALSTPLASRLSRAAGRPVRLFALDTARPIAFALHNAIYLSAGMFDILAPKQLEAVALHEAGHIRRQSGFRIFSAAFAQHFSPFARIAGISGHREREERAADAFAARAQGTRSHLREAKRRVRSFYSA